MTEMTSRERVLATLNHEEPDRVPIDIGGLTSFTCWHEETDIRVKKYLGYEPDKPVINSFFSRTVRPNKQIRDRFQTDFFGLVGKSPDSYQFELHEEEGGGSWFYDEWQIKWRCPPGGHYYDVVEFPLAEATVEEIAHQYDWPDPTDPTRLDGVVEMAKDMYENSDYCLVYTPPWATGVFAVAALMQGWENHLVNMMIDQEVSKAIFEGLTEFHLAHLEMMLDQMGDYIQIINMSDDLGFQDRPMIRLPMFREMVKPYYQRIVDFIKTKSPHMKIVFHTDGAVSQFYPDFIDMGIEATNPVQISCAGMDPVRLKEEFGDKLTFWGAGVDTQSTLPHGTPDEVRAEVKTRLQEMAPGGGYIFATVHNVQYDVPPENVLACYDTALEFRDYPIGE